MNFQTQTHKRVTRTEVLCEKIEAMILDGFLSPGDRLEEVELAKKFGVSRTPVREAIRSLAAIGLVESSGRQGAIVAQISISMLIEMFDLMAVLEGMCAQLAARRATKDERSQMHNTHKSLEKMFENGDHQGFYKVNLDFHDQIYAAGHTQFLADHALRLRVRLSPYRMRVTYHPGRMKATLSEHMAILKAVDNGDSDLAMDAARSHMRLLGSELEDFIASLSKDVKS